MKTVSLLSVNKEQKAAIRYTKGPLLIIAGAGTGKTFVIVEKIKYLIDKKITKPENILALTFTEKASAEMEERIDINMNYGYFQMWISTFHAFAENILKNEGMQIGFPSNFKLLTEAESILFLRKNLFLFDLNYFRPLGNPQKFLQGLLQHFSRLKDEDISPEDYLKWAKKHNDEDAEQNEKNNELVKAYQTYQELKMKEGVLDFSDLIYYLLILFRKRHHVLKQYQKKFTHILIDEFQDTNIAQYNLIKLLCPSKSKPFLTIVGDDSQSIYKFRGASVSNILSFMHEYKTAKLITLRTNYRSNQTILDTAYKLIQHNNPDTLESKLGISKNLISSQPKKTNLEKNIINYFKGDRAEKEADYVIQQIGKLQNKYAFSDFAILARANKHTEVFIQALNQNKIPYQFLGPGALYKQPEVKDLIAYLKTLYNPEDSVSFYRVLNMDIFILDSQDISLLITFSRKINIPLYQTIEIYLSFFYKNYEQNEFAIYKLHIPLLHEPTRIKLKIMYEMIKKHLGLIKKETAGQILYYFLEDTGYLKRIVSYKTEHDEKIVQNISRFFNKLKTYETNHEDASIYSTVDYLDMSMELGESPLTSKEDATQINAVNILTVHSAKGLEFPVVFLINLTQSRFPTHNRQEQIPLADDLIKEILPEGNYHLEEERRLFYVGLTRAKDYLFLTSSKYYGEGKREQKVSPFVIESIGEKNVFHTHQLLQDNKKQLSIFDYKKKKDILIKESTISYSSNPITISYSQIESFNMCPLQYKYYYVIKLPTQTSASLSFGISIHKTLQAFYQDFRKNTSINENALLQYYNNTWIPIGYSSHAHELKMKKEGENILHTFFKEHHDPKIQIIDLEKPFKIKITPTIFLTGKIDRIDKLISNSIEIIDYKTGKKPKQKELENNPQLSIYALAATEKNIYNKKIEQVDLSFFYIQTNEKITLHKTDEDMLRIKESIIETVNQIQKSTYEPHKGIWCDYCPFRMICEAW
ncbi:MAG: UvrD-helicase domain-containing protein [bacterium]|nr:UvrD-helicase domain-containing protein [bacterium]